MNKVIAEMNCSISSTPLDFILAGRKPSERGEANWNKARLLKFIEYLFAKIPQFVRLLGFDCTKCIRIYNAKSRNQWLIVRCHYVYLSSITNEYKNYELL